jgi:hypothetical protein
MQIFTLRRRASASGNLAILKHQLYVIYLYSLLTVLSLSGLLLDPGPERLESARPV